MKKVIILLTSLVFSCGHLIAQTTGIYDFKKISSGVGGFPSGLLGHTDYFGYAVEGIGDLDGDGIPDLAVNAYLDDDGYTNAGAVWILFMNANGTVKGSPVKIANNTNGFGNELGSTDVFGCAIENIGDLNGDGRDDLAVGAMYDDDGGNGRGAIYILFMNTNGTVSSYQKISDTQGGFGGILATYDSFGTSIANLGDMNNDGVTDLAVGAWADNDGGTKHGAVWVLFMNANGTVSSYQKISDTQGNFTGVLGYDDRFGYGVECIGDLDVDGVNDMVVGAIYDDDGFTNAGAVWVLFMNANGTVKTHQKISMDASIGGDLSTYVSLDGVDLFGISNQFMGDFNGDGDVNLMVAARNDDDGGTDKGAIYILELGTDGRVNGAQKISDLTTGNPGQNFSGQLDASDLFGSAVGKVGDLDNDGYVEYVIGTIGDDDGGTNFGAVYLMSFNGDQSLLTSFEPSYAKLKHQLDGGYYLMYNKVLHFQYSEEYEMEKYKKIAYNIYDKDHNLVGGVDLNGTTLVAGSALMTNVAGENKFNLNTTTLSLTVNQYYTLEVINDKKEKQVLKFKVFN